MADKKKDLALMRIKYAAYRRKMSQSPDTIKDTLGFKVWMKQKNNESE